MPRKLPSSASASRNASPTVKRSRKASGVLVTLKPDLLSLANVRQLLSVGDWKLCELIDEGHFVLKDIRNKGSHRPLWRITRASYEVYLKSLPATRSRQQTT